MSTAHPLDKYQRLKPVPNPVSTATLARLESAVTHFIESIGARLARYDALLSADEGLTFPRGRCVDSAEYAVDVVGCEVGSSSDDDSDASSDYHIPVEEKGRPPFLGPFDKAPVVAVRDEQACLHAQKRLSEALRNLKGEAAELRTVMEGVEEWLALTQASLTMSQPTPQTEALQTMRSQCGAMVTSLSEVSKIEDGYLSTLSDLEREMLKYPHVRSLHWAWVANVETAWDETRRGQRALRRIAAVMYTLLQRNLGTFMNPSAPPSAMFQ